MLNERKIKQNLWQSKNILLIVAMVLMFICLFSENSFAADGDTRVQDYNSKNTWNCGYPTEKGPEKFIDEAKAMCWYCSSLDTAVKAIEGLASRVYDSVKDGLAALMAAILAIWLVIKIMTYAASAKYIGADEFYTDIGKTLFKVGLAAAMLLGGTEMWTYTVAPVTSFVFDYGSAVLDAGDSLANVKIASDASSDTGNPISVIGDKLVGVDEKMAGGIIAKINEKLMEMAAFSWVMMSVAFKSGAYCIPFGNFKLFIIALLLMIFAIYYILLLPLKFLDVIFRLGVFLVLMPLFIFAWPFPLSNSLTQKGVRLLLNVMLTFLIYAVVVAVCTELIYTELKFPSLSGKDDTEVLKVFTEQFAADWSKIFMILIYLIYAKSIAQSIDDLGGRLADAVYETSDFAHAPKGSTDEVAGVQKPYEMVKDVASKIKNKIVK